MSLKMRNSGVLLHPTALPGNYGIGEIGPHAYKFVDNLYRMKQTLWQVLPIGPTDNYNSPYSCISTFAGNHLLISFDLLVEDGLLDTKYIKNVKKTIYNRVDFDEVIKFKNPILEHVSASFHSKASNQMKSLFDQFCNENSYWLNDYSLYIALKKVNKQKPWIEWNQKKIEISEFVNREKIIQFLFHDQWNRLRKYCKSKGVKIIGDIPIYVGYDSADVFSNKDLFELDESGKMLYQAGCPPCEYQPDGQVWGNPLYLWDNHKKTNFLWWQKRFKKLFEMVDIIRIDHFIGYAKYFKIPINDKVANNGFWVDAPGNQLFKVLESSIKNFNVFIEDLGDISDEVISLRDKYNYSGMRVLQFEFSKFDHDKKFINNSILYTGTHDNDTLLGWYKNFPEKNNLLTFFKSDKKNIIWDILKYAFKSESRIVIIPFQDLVGLDSNARFNKPGTLLSSNWSWRIDKEYLTEKIISQLSQLSSVNNRNNFE